MMSTGLHLWVLGLVGLAGIAHGAALDSNDPAASPVPGAEAAAGDPDWRESLEPQDPLAADPNPAIEDLGNQRFRIGRIELDRNAETLRVSGTVIRDEPPLEYIAVTKGGFKAYESVLELDVNAYEFNIACVLLGLDAARARRSAYHFDENPVAGDPVEITISWQTEGETRTAAVGDLIHRGADDGREDRWVYTGSMFDSDGVFMAQSFGPLIGFVHDPAAIFDHVQGIGLNDYGSVLTTDTLPPVGTDITLQVRVLSRTEESEPFQPRDSEPFVDGRPGG